ncbi:MAG: hypothetical protein K0R55_3981 [Sporomusa sp.]|jgi:hypothetical protein|nr:hypothetical protein [Sporomusa sp.]
MIVGIVGEVLTALINAKEITMTYTNGAPPHIIYKKSRGFTVVLKCGAKTMRFSYHTGLDTPLDLIQVVSWLLVRSEAIGFTYKQYCPAFGYYAGSKAKRLYYRDRELGKKLKEFLGADFENFCENNDY